MTTNKFTTADQEGREMFKHYCNQQSWCKVIKESKDEFSPWDISYLSAGTMCIGEIKVREYNSDSFADWYLEKKKYDSLQEIKTKVDNKKQKQSKIHYINFFKDEAVKIWDVTTMNDEHTVLMPATTMGNQKMVATQVYDCNLTNEVDRGLLNGLEFETNDNDEDDNLPF